ncbi:MAG: prolipoprotein diacylglyceryl transferase [Chloroflexi bacterium]|nr:prolipoprotein diacylglyceryl transferase [Chloroflexota bacterium]
MTISYGPYAFGSPFITWAALFMLAGILVGGALFIRGTSRYGLERRTAFGIVLFSVFGGLLGARLFHILDYLDFFTAAPFHAVYLWEGGFSLWGGVLGGLAAGLWKAGREGLVRAEIADAAVAPGVLGLAVGRLGGFIGGDPAAAGSSLPLAVTYDHPHSVAFADGAAVHPVALYEMLWNIAVALCVVRWGRCVPTGVLMPLALAGWGAGRFVIAFVRLDPVTVGLQQAQWMGLLVVAAVLLWAWRSRLWLRLRARDADGRTPRGP